MKIRFFAFLLLGLFSFNSYSVPLPDYVDNILSQTPHYVSCVTSSYSGVYGCSVAGTSCKSSFTVFPDGAWMSLVCLRGTGGTSNNQKGNIQQFFSSNYSRACPDDYFYSSRLNKCSNKDLGQHQKQTEKQKGKPICPAGNPCDTLVVINIKLRLILT
ncbi:hypothetical protein [Abyssogena phaseoliformis symbiont]|uniref:hypothetical protein n=1 Tax=Abyssogena phaseoliformis symbiont TaxID=596095 RepID=UPI001916BD36|nr:hypothetical protein [Abyssogena phaseoliformis symbiont]